MERLHKTSSLPNALTRLSFCRSYKAPAIDTRSMAFYSAGATPLKLQDLRRIELQPMPANLSRYWQKRWMIFDQFITHEENYLKAMHILQYEIFNPLLQDGDIVDRNILQAVFGTQQKIYKLHQFYQPLLRVCAEEWPDRYLAGWMIWAMLEQPSLGRLYSVFISHYPRTVALAMNASNDLFAWFIQSKLREFGEHRNFTDHYIMAVQRIPQLVLEVKDMHNHTQETDPDRAMVERCLQLATALGEQLNIASGKNETVQAVLDATKRRNGSYLHGSYQCELLKSASLTERFSNGTGTRLILLLSDRLVCAKRPTPKNKPGPSKWKFGKPKTDLIGPLKWVLPLQEIEVDGEELGDSRMLESVSSVESIDSIGNIRDFETIANVRELLSTFHQTHDNFSVDACNEAMDRIWSTVLLQEDALEAGHLLRLKVKHSKKPYILQMANADAKKEWCNAIRLAQLALRPENTPAWWNCTLYAPYEPLFVKTFTAGEQDDTVTGGCSYVPNTKSPAYANELFRVLSENQHILWISTLDKANNSKVSLYTHDRIRNVVRLRASFTLPNTKITFIAHVPEGMIDDNTTTDTVWIATRSRILIYSATFPMISDQLKCIRIKGTPNRMLYHGKRMFVGTASKRLLIFSLTEAGTWDLQTPQQLQCGIVEAMAVVDSHVYMAITTNILVYDSNTGTFVQQVSSPATSVEDKRFISMLQYSVHGLWVGRHRSGIISLYQTESFKHLLDINIADQIDRFLFENGADRFTTQVCVSSMKVVDNILWVGTDVGVLLTMHLPKRANVPIVADELLVSYHGHLKNITLIMSLPSLRVVPAQSTERLEVEPTIVDNLFVNSRNMLRDLTATRVGNNHDSFTFIDTQEELFYDTLDNACSGVDDLNVSLEYEEDEKMWTDGAKKVSGEKKLPIHTPWTPDSTLILTGGHGYVKRAYKTAPNTASHGLNRSQSVSDVAEDAAEHWNTNAVSNHGNMILWEKR